MGQPTQRATNYTARSNLETAQIVLHANGQRPKSAPISRRLRRRQRHGEPHTEHGLGVLLLAGGFPLCCFPPLVFPLAAVGGLGPPPVLCRA